MDFSILEQPRAAKGARQDFPHVAPRYFLIQPRQFDVIEDNEVSECCGFDDFVEAKTAVVGRAGDDGSCRVTLLSCAFWHGRRFFGRYHSLQLIVEGIVLFVQNHTLMKREADGESIRASISVDLQSWSLTLVGDLLETYTTGLIFLPTHPHLQNHSFQPDGRHFTSPL